ncbi:hypothetical protein H9Q72_014612, partial [Fusarium xylarioides]
LDDDNPQELTQNTAAGIAMAALAALEGIGLDGGEPGDLNLEAAVQFEGRLDQKALAVDQDWVDEFDG